MGTDVVRVDRVNNEVVNRGEEDVELERTTDEEDGELERIESLKKVLMVVDDTNDIMDDFDPGGKG